MERLVEIERLKKRFGPITAVNDLSFNVVRGEVLGFLGPNGAGKSTTMKMITGFLAADHGRVRIAGIDLSDDPVAVKRRVGYLPEGAPLYGDMTPAGFLDFVAELRGFRGADKSRKVAAAVDRTHLRSVLHQRSETLSKGFKRRVGLAQAILHDPEVLVLDEPTDGLDPNQKHEVRSLIRTMAPRKAIILSTHILEEVHAVCTRALIIAGGNVVADGTPAELEARSRRHNSVVLVIRGQEQEARRKALRSLPGVCAVEVLGSASDTVRYQVYPNEGSQVLAPVSRLAHDQSWDVLELYTERGRLDEVFRDITVEKMAMT